MSAAWALHLRDRYDLPAVAVAGDLRVADRWLFRASEPMPEFQHTGSDVITGWRGHCWVELGGMVCDATILRTVYGFSLDDAARQCFEGLAGSGHGAFIAKASELPRGLKYRRQSYLRPAGIYFLISQST